MITSSTGSWPPTRELLRSVDGERWFSTWPPPVFAPTDPRALRNAVDGHMHFARDAAHRAAYARARGRLSCALMWGRIATRDLVFAQWFRARLNEPRPARDGS